MYRFVMNFKSKVASVACSRSSLLALTSDGRDQRQRGTDALFSGANEDLRKEVPDRAYMARFAGRSQGRRAMNSPLPIWDVAP